MHDFCDWVPVTTLGPVTASVVASKVLTHSLVQRPVKEWFWLSAATSEAFTDSSAVTRTRIQQLCTFQDSLHSALITSKFDLLSEASPTESYLESSWPLVYARLPAEKQSDQPSWRCCRVVQCIWQLVLALAPAVGYVGY